MVFLRHGVDKGFQDGKAIGYNAAFYANTFSALSALYSRRQSLSGKRAFHKTLLIAGIRKCNGFTLDLDGAHKLYYFR